MMPPGFGGGGGNGAGGSSGNNSINMLMGAANLSDAMSPQQQLVHPSMTVAHALQQRQQPVMQMASSAAAAAAAAAVQMTNARLMPNGQNAGLAPPPFMQIASMRSPPPMIVRHPLITTLDNPTTSRAPPANGAVIGAMPPTSVQQQQQQQQQSQARAHQIRLLQNPIHQQSVPQILILRDQQPGASTSQQQHQQLQQLQQTQAALEQQRRRQAQAALEHQQACILRQRHAQIALEHQQQVQAEPTTSSQTQQRQHRQPPPTLLFASCDFCKQDWSSGVVPPASHMLTCMHVACPKCVTQMRVESQKSSVRCRLCSCVAAALEIPLLDDVQSIRCSNCAPTTKALRWCVQCKKNLCDVCTNRHTSYLVLGHQLQAIEPPARVYLNCVLHARPLNRRCSTCCQLLCQSCTTIEHEGHDVVELSSAERTTLDDMLVNVVPRQRATVEVAEKIEQTRTRLDEAAKGLKTHVASAAVSLCQEILARSHDLCETIDNVVSEKVKANLLARDRLHANSGAMVKLAELNRRLAPREGVGCPRSQVLFDQFMELSAAALAERECRTKPVVAEALQPPPLFLHHKTDEFLERGQLASAWAFLSRDRTGSNSIPVTKRQNPNKIFGLVAERAPKTPIPLVVGPNQPTPLRPAMDVPAPAYRNVGLPTMVVPRLDSSRPNPEPLPSSSSSSSSQSQLVRAPRPGSSSKATDADVSRKVQDIMTDAHRRETETATTLPAAATTLPAAATTLPAAATTLPAAATAQEPAQRASPASPAQSDDEKRLRYDQLCSVLFHPKFGTHLIEKMAFMAGAQKEQLMSKEWLWRNPDVVNRLHPCTEKAILVLKRPPKNASKATEQSKTQNQQVQRAQASTSSANRIESRADRGSTASSVSGHTSPDHVMLAEVKADLEAIVPQTHAQSPAAPQTHVQLPMVPPRIRIRISPAARSIVSEGRRTTEEDGAERSPSPKRLRIVLPSQEREGDSEGPASVPTVATSSTEGAAPRQPPIKIKVPRSAIASPATSSSQRPNAEAVAKEKESARESTLMSPDRWEDYCLVCAEGGDLLCCYKCPKVFHTGCHAPAIRQQLEDLPDDWLCARCQPLEPIVEVAAEGQQTQLTDNERLACAKVLLDCYDVGEEAQHFRKSVSPRIAGYYKMIERPMHFTKVAEQIDVSPSARRNHFATVADFIEAMNCVFRNASIFNAPTDPVTIAAEKVCKAFGESVRRWIPCATSLVWHYVSLFDLNLRESAKRGGGVEKRKSPVPPPPPPQQQQQNQTGNAADSATGEVPENGSQSVDSRTTSQSAHRPPPLPLVKKDFSRQLPTSEFS